MAIFTTGLRRFAAFKELLSEMYDGLKRNLAQDSPSRLMVRSLDFNDATYARFSR